MTTEKDTLPAPPPCRCMEEIRDLLADIVNSQTAQAEEIKSLRAGVDQCINYIQREALANAAAARLSGREPGTWQEEDTNPGG